MSQQSIEEQIREWIRIRADEYCLDDGPYYGFIDGCNLLLPLLMKAIEQRDKYIVTAYGCPNILIRESNAILIQLLEASQKEG